MRRLTLTALALGGSWWHWAAQAQQQEDPEAAPDLDFLEYLGAWAEDDDEWLAIEEWHKGNAEKEAEGRDRERNRRIPEQERKDDDESE